MNLKKYEVVIAMGSRSDLTVMKAAAEALQKFGIAHDMLVLSAHRTPREVARFAESARQEGVKVIIAGAGGAAHLPGMIASYTDLPVIGVPVPLEILQGQDSLLSIVQMPKGVPVATVAIGNAWNAGILAAQILSLADSQSSQTIRDALSRYKQDMQDEVIKNPELID